MTDDEQGPTGRPTVGLYQRFATDPELEERGQWVDFGDGAEFRIASSASKRADRALQAHRKKYRRYYLSGKDIPFEVRQDAEVVHAAACLTEWRGPAIVNRAGQPLPYSPAAAMTLMTDLRELRGQVLLVAHQAETHRAEWVDALGKTSPPSSAPTSSDATAGTS
jgi:hypothetical protein